MKGTYIGYKNGRATFINVQLSNGTKLNKMELELNGCPDWIPYSTITLKIR